MRQHTARFALFLLGGAFVLGLLALAWMLGPGVSQAEDATMHNCSQAGKWAISVWDGPDGTDVSQALDTCGPGAVAAAYYLDPQTQLWVRWFAGRPEVSNLKTLNRMQGVIAFGAAGAQPTTATPTPTPTVTATPTPTVFTGKEDENTPVFEVTESPFRISWTTESDSPQYAGFGFFMYREGETTGYLCDGQYSFTDGSDFTICHAPPGRYWFRVLAANLTSWRIEIGAVPPTSDLPVTFTGRHWKTTPTFHVSGLTFTMARTVQSDTPADAEFVVFIYRGDQMVTYETYETVAGVCEFLSEGVASDTTVCYTGPGDFYAWVLTDNVTSWRLDITEP